MSEGLPPGGVEITEAQAAARWTKAWTPAEVTGRLAGLAAPWCVAGGWALDDFRGGRSRAHSDLEISVPAARFPELVACLPGYDFDVVASGRLWSGRSPELLELTHQTWLRDPSTGEYLVDVFREPHDGPLWICRRDPSIRLPYTEVVERSPDGIPYLAPELVLLFKAKGDRAKDRLDFTATLPLLDATRRARLADLLGRAHPGHPWLAEL
ncbi:hypothetical protein OG689_00715 [Kitasatospora sp. NBC_00240]|uniref:nucleotidyltransferase domain-containing protein n=1 Tax=Kitasatospora sp. NBC_00240 TaxID=2903567 RepID=UPI00224FD6D2|nr:hypothetical protein [Kitasatospora sp. NBC_00240]MCX5207855.1 hypothetical protein [Kitasatospora sp. NBC_00240]